MDSPPPPSSSSSSLSALETLVAHIQGLSGNPSELGHLHSLLRQSEDVLRLHAAHLSPFLNLLDPSIHSLGYLYLLGMIYIGMKNFPKALECLYNVVTAPMTALNAIAVEAYKKYVLVSLIQNGQVPSFPKFTSSAAQRNLKSYCQPYIDLANCYINGKFADLEACIQSNSEKFQTDNNLGLAKQVLSSLYKRNIQRLTQTYLTLSLQDIANSVQLNTSKEAEMHVLQMIQDGEIFATINQKDGMVSFHEDPEQYKSCNMIENIDSCLQRLIAVSKRLSSIDEQISCDPAYLSKIGRERPRYDFDDFDSVPHKFL